MDFSLEAYPFPEYVADLLSRIKLVAFAEITLL